MTQLKELTVFIPAAGYGTRMGDICKNNQKCMLRVGINNKPILYYIINNLISLGCTKFVIAVNHCKEEIINYFKDGKEFGVDITYIDGMFTSTYDTLMKCIDKLPDTFVYSHGDMIFKKEVYESLIDNYNKYNTSVISIVPNTYPEMTHPRIVIEDDNIKDIIFKDNFDKYNYMYLGGAIYNKKDFLDNYNNNNSGMVEKMITQKLNKNENIKYIIYNKEWAHFMNKTDLESAKDIDWL